MKRRASHIQKVVEPGANRQWKGRLYILGIIVLHILLGALYWYYTPYGASPDESAHGIYIRKIAIEHRLPIFSADDSKNYEAHQPPLYYVLGALFYMAAKMLGSENPAAAARLLSLILGTFSIFIIYRTITVFPENEGLAVACAGFVAFLPMHLTLSVSVSNDMLTELLFGASLLSMTRILAFGSNGRNTIILGLLLGLGLLTKTTCILLFPLATLAYLFSWRIEGKSRVLLQLISTLGIGFVLGGWWLIRNKLLYGDFFAASEFVKAFEQTARPQYWLQEQSLSLVSYILLVGGWTFASFWGVFGQMKVFMQTWVYLLLGLLTLISGIAFVPAVFHCIKTREINDGGVTRQAVKYTLLLYGAAVVFVLAAFISFNFSYFQAQGRYLYPALMPLSLFWVLGFRHIFPSVARKYVPGVVVVGMLCLAFYALFACVATYLPNLYGVQLEVRFLVNNLI
ncbi:MAG: hypothetical protein QME62_01715 [Armatimonadota bacterium]|nr:hypothetical protein [Armatimonadota bacterium]